jgi:hypothetical protein
MAGQYLAQLKSAPTVAKPDPIDDKAVTKIDASKQTAKGGRLPNMATYSPSPNLSP